MSSSEQMPILRATHRWRLPEPQLLDPGLLEAARSRGLPERVLGILAARGHRTAADLSSFFDAPELGLHDPGLLPDAQRFATRIARARAGGDGVLVFGDFDADGLTGLVILVLCLRRLGIDAEPYVPSRLDEGHGLSMGALERAWMGGRRVIVTVDTGTSSPREVAAAASLGLDVLITDHHSLPPVLPAAAALVNPHRPDSRYPDPRLAGSGVAFKLAQLLLSDAPGGPEAAMDLAALATIGTVADVAPIVGENRAICRIGLERLRHSPRPGLAALLRASGVDPAHVDLDTISYALAPRLNAGGRMGEPMTAARLLLADDPLEAETLAAELDRANLARREQTREVLAEARLAADVEPDAPAIVVSGDWPVGIIGLVAGKLAEERNRPAVVVSRGAQPWRGSARSPLGFDLAAAFESCAEHFERHGGHPQAAGCSLAESSYEAFRERFLGLASAAAFDPRPELALDLVLPAADVGYPLYRELEALAPTGPGNPEVLVGIGGLVVTRVRPAGDEHAQLTLRKGREVLDAICFDRADLLATVTEDQEVEVVARLASRTFGGFESLQLEIRDVAPVGVLAAALEGSARARTAAVPALVAASGEL